MKFKKMMLGIAIILCTFNAFSFGCNTNCSANAPCENPCPPPEKTRYTPCPSCCATMGGVSYCDSSSGRFVCQNGAISACYCARNAVMDLQKIQGCCLWQGGVMATDETGLIICNNGGISEVCSQQSITNQSGQSFF